MNFRKNCRPAFFAGLLIAGCLWPGPAVAVAGGFQTIEQSSRALGMGGISVGCFNDPAAIHTNPALLSFLEGTNLSFGSTVVLPEHRFTLAGAGESTVKMMSQVFFPPNFSIMHTFGNGVGLAFSTTVPFMLQTEWDQDWVGKRIATKSQLRSTVFSPALGFRLSSGMSVGVALNLAATHVQWSRRIGFPPPQENEPDGTVTMDGDSRFGVGFQASLLFQPNDVWSLGAVFQSRMNVDIDKGQIRYTDIPSDLLANYTDGSASSHLTLPESFRIGLGFRPFGRIFLGAEAQFTGWSSFDAITITYQNAVPASDDIRQEWRDSFTLRGGIEIGFSDLNLRAGIVFDQTPVPDSYVRPSMPDADRLGYCVGFGYLVGEGLTIDFAIASFKYKDRNVVNSRVEYQPGKFFNGLYTSSSTAVGLNVAYAWN